MYMNCQVRARLVLRKNCFGVVGPTRARLNLTGSIQSAVTAGYHKPARTF
jgi:hypothetical protein